MAAQVAHPSHLAASMTTLSRSRSLSRSSLGTAKVAAAIFACLSASALALLSACDRSFPLLSRARSTLAALVCEGIHTKLAAGTSSMWLKSCWKIRANGRLAAHAQVRPAWIASLHGLQSLRMVEPGAEMAAACRMAHASAPGISST